MYAGRADDGAVDGERRARRTVVEAPVVADELRDAEIEDFDLGVAIAQQDVLGLQVAVQDALAVRGIDRRADLRK